MKELSIKAKAKRYDEAVEKARQLCAYPTSKPFISDLQDLFPELIESEDDRIRKSLIELFHDTVSNDEIFSDYGLDKTEVLAWLEKQGEQIDIVNKEYWRGYREGKKEILDKYAELEKQGNNTDKVNTDKVELMSSWKPTEEQIEALEHLLETIRRHEYSYFHEEKFLSLHSLLEQLKEL